MISRKKSVWIRYLAILLVFIYIVPTTASAIETETPSVRASDYLTSYNAYIYPAALGKIQVYFSVTGVNYMDEIGALSVQLYESTDGDNWTWVKTYRHSTTSGMLGYDDIYHSGHVDYSGTIGRYYKAYVCIWAGKDGTGDTRYFWTQPKKATLFAG